MIRSPLPEEVLPKRPDTAGHPSWINLSRSFIKNVLQKKKKKG